MNRGFKSRANKLSKKIRLKIGLKVNDYLDPRLLAELMKVTIIDPTELIMPKKILMTLLSVRKDEWSALGVNINGKSYIFLNTSHAETRIEASIMHELAHFILEHEPMGAMNYFGIPLIRFNKEQEEEAEFLGGCLQIPDEAIFPLFAFKGYNLKKLSKHFHCSEDLARMRYNLSGTKYRLSNYKSNKYS